MKAYKRISHRELGTILDEYGIFNLSYPGTGSMCPCVISAEPQSVTVEKPKRKIEKKVLLETTESWDKTPIPSYPQGRPKITAVFINIPAGMTLKNHKHPMYCCGLVMSGKLTIQRTDGKMQTFTASQVISETVDTIHSGFANEDTVLYVVYAGVVGQELSE